MISTQLAPASEREAAFKVLQEIATLAARRGRLCYAASAKPQLIQALGHTESDLGYVSFRELLRDAESAGWVTLTYVSAGDVQIEAASSGLANNGTAAIESDVEPTSSLPSQSRPVVRRDFWQGVVRPGTWLYDPHIDGVVTQASAGTREDLVALPTADEETQRGWVADFVATLPTPRQAVLGPILTEADLKGQLEILGRQPGPIRNAWYDFRALRVLERLEKWKKDNGVEVHVTRPRPGRHTTPSREQKQRTREEPAAAELTREAVVRERLHEAIDRMPLSDLLRLSIPAEHLIDG
jgi:hypothetical protein